MPGSLSRSDQHTVPSLWRIRTSSFLQLLTPFAIGLILSLAGGLKLYSLVTSHPISDGTFFSRQLTLTLSICEMLLAVWLVSGIRPQIARKASIGLFFVFLIVSTLEAISGKDSCGCFGPVKVNPWYSAAIDLAALITLWLWRPIFTSQEPARIQSAALSGLIVPLTGLVLFLVHAGVSDSSSLSDNGDIVGDGRMIVLHPDTWVGKRLPLLKHIDIGQHLAIGEWVMILYRRRCPTCARLMSSLEELAQDRNQSLGGPNIAFVELPPYANSEPTILGPNETCMQGRLSDLGDWVVETPMILTIFNGEVVAATGKAQNDGTSMIGLEGLAKHRTGK